MCSLAILILPIYKHHQTNLLAHLGSDKSDRTMQYVVILCSLIDLFGWANQEGMEPILLFSPVMVF